MHKSKSWRWLLLALLLPFFTAALSRAQVGISISANIAPPVLPVYEQPLCPDAGMMWTPGYWGWGDDGYYWVPGEWVPAPFTGALWTPPYWGWNNGQYAFNAGYWGTTVGYYGGINYGFGYMGVGFVGGEWRSGGFAYNTAVMRVNTTVIHNTYVDRTIVRQNTIVNNSRVAYNGGPGGIRHAPTAQERVAMNAHHTPATAYQQQHIAAARADRTSYAKVNGGHPHNVVVAKPVASERSAARPESESHGSARPSTAAHETRPTPAHRAGEAEPSARNEHESHPVTPSHPATESRPESHTSTARTEHESHPVTPSHPATEPRPESHESTASRSEHESHPVTPSHPAAEPKPESHPSESHPSTANNEHKSSPSMEVHPKSESHPAPTVTEVRPEPKPETPKPTNTAKAEHDSHPAPESHPAPSPERKSTPAPEAHESHPAPETHAAPSHEHAPSAPPKEEKPKP
jgi:hypothetical protein